MLVGRYTEKKIVYAQQNNEWCKNTMIHSHIRFECFINYISDLMKFTKP